MGRPRRYPKNVDRSVINKVSLTPSTIIIVISLVHSIAVHLLYCQSSLCQIGFHILLHLHIIRQA